MPDAPDALKGVNETFQAHNDALMELNKAHNAQSPQASQAQRKAQGADYIGLGLGQNSAAGINILGKFFGK